MIRHAPLLFFADLYTTFGFVKAQAGNRRQMTLTEVNVRYLDYLARVKELVGRPSAALLGGGSARRPGAYHSKPNPAN
jgi:hypothetical protein